MSRIGTGPRRKALTLVQTGRSGIFGAETHTVKVLRGNTQKCVEKRSSCASVPPNLSDLAALLPAFARARAPEAQSAVSVPRLRLPSLEQFVPAFYARPSSTTGTCGGLARHTRVTAARVRLPGAEKEYDRFQRKLCNGLSRQLAGGQHYSISQLTKGSKL